jgi:hypothetical protein
VLDGWRLQDLTVMEGVGRERKISRLDITRATAHKDLDGTAG